MEIKVENLSLKLKNNQILNDITFCLPQGKFIMLLGPNGSGKTQLIKTIMGFRNPDNGQIYYDKKDIFCFKIKERAKFVSYVPQIDDEKSRYRVKEFISMGFTPDLEFYQSPSQKMNEEISKTLSILGIEHLSDKFTNEISGGEYRLSYLARALVQNTPWMILDEPISSLDFTKQHKFLHLLKETTVQKNKGVFISIHDPSLALKYGDILFLMKNGEIIDIIDMDNNEDSTRLENGLRELYGYNTKLEDTSFGKVLVWKEH